MKDFDAKKHMLLQYTGTIESYNFLVDHLWDKRSGYNHIWFIDEDGEITPKFTGIVCDAMTGIKYHPGVFYSVAAEENPSITLD